MKLFVPGRICLFGEHTDWAGGYRRINAALEKGYALIVGTNQGVHAEVRPHPNQLILKATLNDGTRMGPYAVPMERGALLAEAEKGGFFSYAAGVAYQVLTHYRVRGLEIDNYLTDLPIKKGLSSSAAICVLVARAFNRIYDLKMTVRGEMEYAYAGEITTPSRCGRLDQGCAYGNRPVLMTFDGDRLDVTELNVPKTLYYVIVDLQAGKDTREILSKLNKCYPFAENELQRIVQKYLGPLSAEITHSAIEALERGDAPALGELMNRAQAEFDRHLQPACPSQLTAPVLHQVLSYPPIQPYVLGGKGVGSQGDGVAQFLVQDEAAQDTLIEIVERDLKMPCTRLSIRSAQRVRKAVIPAAGYGTRLFPATKAIKKELFPIVDRDGRAKPVILAIVEEALSSGIEEVCVIVQKEDRDLFEEFFGVPPAIEHFNKLSTADQEYCRYLMEVGRKVTLITQDVQEGFGHAVYCAREWVGSEPFLLLLGDHLYGSDSDAPCSRQLLDVYEKVRHSVVGLKVTPAEEIRHFGCAAGVWETPGRVLSITEFAEKPDPEYAAKHLRVEGMDEGKYLTLFGQYILSPKIFDYLEEQIGLNMREKGEFQLTSCMDRLRQEDGFSGYLVQGRRFDIGLPEAYRQTVIDFRNA
ncbi:MAG TPA: sugar phosphate nucleotidyltransferase [Anaerolineaceae bacterium]|nr:sugar phosphate nucleotidyltransferase [Anaerolineaceae bacterium]